MVDGVDISWLVYNERISQGEINIIRRARLDYLAVDLRLTTVTPTFGVFFEGGENAAIHSKPLNASALLKFKADNGFNRVFDNGLVQIYGLKGVRHATP